jgi:hypothetical protein
MAKPRFLAPSQAIADHLKPLSHGPYAHLRKLEIEQKTLTLIATIELY